MTGADVDWIRLAELDQVGSKTADLVMKIRDASEWDLIDQGWLQETLLEIATLQLAHQARYRNLVQMIAQGKVTIIDSDMIGQGPPLTEEET